MYLSVITIGEIRKGVDLIPIPKLELEPVDDPEAWKKCTTLVLLPIAGKPMPAIDALIAATAVVHNLAVVTHDTAFKRLSYHVTVYDPWSDTPSAR